jgi:apolipoprotein N-acyltransferase
MVMKKILNNNIILSVLSGLILCLGWTQLGIGWTIFIGFIPLLFVMENLLNSNKKRKAARFLGLSYISFFIWNAISTWWIKYSTTPGAIAAIAISSLLMAFIMYINIHSFKFFGRRVGYIAFVVNWITFEYLFMNSEISWPWLILGNAFSNNISLIQWYEYVGHLGGSLWIMIINVIIYEIIRLTLLKRKTKNYVIGLSCLIFVPIVFSLVIYYTHEDQGTDVDIVVIQPNIDPYNEKFASLSLDSQIDIILNEAYEVADNNVCYFIAPETAIPNYMPEDELNEEYSVILIKEFLNEYPNAKFIIGATTRTYYENGIGKTITSRKINNTNNYYDIFNTSLQIDTSDNVCVYHKSRLVPGVEMMPYPKIFGFLQDLMINLGGIPGSLGTQKERSVFPNDNLGINIGAPICYESAYGEFIGEFVQKGANLLFVITNDGWWRDTPGYKQHRSFSKIRAVETRKSIARSANTGISCFINQRGEVLQELGWWQRGTLRKTIKANDKITLYTKYGDFLARMSLVASIIILVIQIVNSVLTKLKIRDLQKQN